MMTTKHNPFDLGTVNPCGRVDVLAAKSLDHLALRVPELKPIIDQHREVIHKNIAKHLSPDSLGIDLVPYLPLLEAATVRLINIAVEKRGVES